MINFSPKLFCIKKIILFYKYLGAYIINAIKELGDFS